MFWVVIMTPAPPPSRPPFWKRPEWQDFWPTPAAFAGIVAASIGVFVTRWVLAHRDEAQVLLTVILLYIGLPLVLLWVVVRVIRFAWTGK